jgi:hypothetical protein
MEEKEICKSILCIGSPLAMGLSMHCPQPPTLPWATILVVGTRDLSLGCCLGRGLSLFTMDFMWYFQPPLQGTIDMFSWVYLTPTIVQNPHAHCANSENHSRMERNLPGTMDKSFWVYLT